MSMSEPVGVGPAGGSAAAAQPVARAAARGVPWWMVAAAAAIAAVALWWAGERTGRVERDLSRRVQDVERAGELAGAQLRAVSDALRDAQARAALLEAKLADLLGQQAQLRQLYDEIARNRGDLVLADVENSIMIAAQQLQLAGNVPAALAALQDAEQLLARSSQGPLIGLRRVLVRDIERLKALPLADFAAAVNRLDAVIGSVDQLPLLAEVHAPAAGSGASAASGPGADGTGLRERVARTGQQGFDGFLAELRRLFRVQRVDRPEALLLAPEQRYFVREHLRLMLLNARLNLLARSEALFRADLGRAIAVLERWFDTGSRPVAAAAGTLRQLQSAPLTIEAPSLSEAVSAVRAARAAADRP
jgi:uncharacterized protein HemX